MDPITIMMIAGAASGTGFGLFQNEKRANQAVQNRLRAETMYDIAEANRKKSRAILDGNLTGSLLQTNANNRELAKAEFQKNAMSEAALGVSGTTGGTPFYKLDADIFESARKLDEATMMSRIQNEGARTGFALGTKEAEAGIQNALWNLQDADAEARYANSPMAAILAGTTGALQGASVGMQIEGALRSANIIKERTKKSPSDPADVPGASAVPSKTYTAAESQVESTVITPATVNPAVPAISNPWLNGAPRDPFSGVNQTPYMGMPPAKPMPKMLNTSPWSVGQAGSYPAPFMIDTPWSLTNPITQAMGGNMKQKGMSLSGFNLTGR